MNLNFIGAKDKDKKIDTDLVDKIIKTMNKFGVGEASSKFGFGGSKSSDDKGLK